MIVIRKRTIVIILSCLVLSLAVLYAIKGNAITVSGNVRQIPIYSVENNEGNVSITFDCAWGAKDIPVILNILKEKDVKATFFVVGVFGKYKFEQCGT
jgi:peptidoglycan/xylan/chitin deacetylase (PgdA/CDA1 family)